MNMEETACWAEKVTDRSPRDPLRQRTCRVVIYAHRFEIQEQAREFAALKGFMPEITDTDQRYRDALRMVAEMWFFLGPQQNHGDLANAGVDRTASGG
jgi:hypothetical protein